MSTKSTPSPSWRPLSLPQVAVPMSSLKNTHLLSASVDPRSRSATDYMNTVLPSWREEQEKQVRALRAQTELSSAGIEHRLSHHIYGTDFSVDFAIRCRDGNVILHVPREFDFNKDEFATTKRFVIETLLDQLQQALAVEALEGR